MSRLPLMLSMLVFAGGVGGLLAAQPPKEPTHDGKTLTEWVKQLTEGKDAEALSAARSLDEMSRHSDLVVGRLFATACQLAGDEKNANRKALVVGLLSEIGPGVVPTLTQNLYSDDVHARRVALAALKDLGADGQSAAPSVARLLANPTDPSRELAVDTLHRVGGRVAISALTKVLDDRNPGTRSDAARYLVSLGADAGVVLPVLTELLKDREQREKAAAWLGRLGQEATPAVPALIALLPEAEELLLATVVEVLGDIGPGAKEAVPALKKRLGEGKKIPPHIQMRFAETLWLIARAPDAAKLYRTLIEQNPNLTYLDQKLWRIDSGPETVALLEKQLKSEKPEEAIAAAHVLGTKSKDAVPLLAKSLTDKEARIRAKAVIALVQLGSQGKEALPALRTAMKDEVPQIAFWATVAACRLDPKAEAVAAVADFVGNPSPAIREDAVVALGLLGAAAKPAVPKLTLALSETDPYAKLAAAVALWKIDQHPTALPAVAELLQSTDRRVREQAALEIGGTFGPEAKSATSALVKRLFDPFAAVRSAAAESLGRVGPGASKAAPALLAVLEGDEPAFVQSAACEALGLIDPLDKEGAAAVLKKKLEHFDPLVRVHAALALHRLGDKAGEKVAERLLSHRTYQVRITAAEALWGMKKDERVVPLLVRTLEESNLDGTGSDNERYMAARALGRIGASAKPAVPELLKLIGHHDAALATTASAALKAIDPEAAKKAGVP